MNWIKLAIATISLFVGAAHAGATHFVSIKNEQVNLRAEPSTEAKVLYELKIGYPLQVISKDGKWLEVRDFEGDEGWVHESVTSSDPHKILKTEGANIRSKANKDSDSLAVIKYGEVLSVLGKKGSWVHIETADGVNGWVHKNLLWGF